MDMCVDKCSFTVGSTSRIFDFGEMQVLLEFLGQHHTTCIQFSTNSILKSMFNHQLGHLTNLDAYASHNTIHGLISLYIQLSPNSSYLPLVFVRPVTAHHSHVM